MAKKARKPGSGRTKGSFSFVTLTLGELNEKFKDPSQVVIVGRKWAEPLFPNKISAPIQTINGKIAGESPETRIPVKVTNFNED